MTYDYRTPEYHLEGVLNKNKSAAEETAEAFNSLMEAIACGALEYDEAVFLDDAKKAILNCMECLYCVQTSVEAVLAEAKQKRSEGKEKEETAGE